MRWLTRSRVQDWSGHPCPVGLESSRAARARCCSLFRKGSGPGGQRGGALVLPGGVPRVDGLSAHAEQAGDRGLGELALVEQLSGDQAPFLVLGGGSGRGEGKLHGLGFPSSLGRQPTHQRSVVPLGLLSLACLGYEKFHREDSEFTINIDSEYLPRHIVERSWCGEFPT